jgi:hypothetical protein
VSHVGAQAWLRLLEILQRESLDPGVRKLLLPLLRYYTHWRPDLVNLDAIMTLAESPAFARHRNYVLDYVVERFVFTAPEAFTEETLGRIEEVFRGARRYRYFLDSLMTRPGTRETVKKRIAGALANRFPLRPLAASVLKTRPFKLLVILNVRRRDCSACALAPADAGSEFVPMRRERAGRAVQKRLGDVSNARQTLDPWRDFMCLDHSTLQNAWHAVSFTRSTTPRLRNVSRALSTQLSSRCRRCVCSLCGFSEVPFSLCDAAQSGRTLVVVQS